VLSRLMEFSFRPVSPKDIAALLVRIVKAEGMVTVDTSLVKHLALESRGNARSAVMALDLAARAGVSHAKQYVALTGSSDNTADILTAMVEGDLEMVLQRTSDAADAVGVPSVVLARLIRALRDVIVLRAGGVLNPPNEPLRDLALRIPNERVLAALRTLWDARTRLRSLTDPRQDLDLVVILVTQVLDMSTGPEKPLTAAPEPAPEPAHQATPEPSTDRRVTLADLQRLR
jgi:DNA polymerase III gamma/tau subunit